VGPGELQSHIKALDNGADPSRREVIHRLKQYEEQEWDAAPPKLIQTLVESLQQQLGRAASQPLIRQEIATTLGSMGARAEAAVPELKELLNENLPHGVREAAACALGRIGKKSRVAVDELIALLSSGRPTLVIQAVRALGDIGCADARVRTALVTLWLSPQSVTVHLQTAIALCKLKIEATGLLRLVTNTLVASREVPVRKAAAEALSWCDKGDLDVVPALLAAALKEKDDDVREAAEAALRRLRLAHEKAVQICVDQLKDSVHAESALRQSGQLAVPCLIVALGADEPVVREKAVRILGSLGEAAAGAVGELTAVLQDKDPDVRLTAAKSLWNISKNPELVVPVLVRLLRDKQPAARESTDARRRFLQTVMEALQRIGPPAKAAIPALAEKAKDANRIVSESAQTALKEIGDPARATSPSR
jgi:HEAT repeat protein